MALALVCSGALVFSDLPGGEAVGEEGRVSLRDESQRGGGLFFVGYGRSHRGGGVRGGK
jgi:hypothetical protein